MKGDVISNLLLAFVVPRDWRDEVHETVDVIGHRHRVVEHAAAVFLPLTVALGEGVVASGVVLTAFETKLVEDAADSVDNKSVVYHRGILLFHRCGEWYDATLAHNLIQRATIQKAPSLETDSRAADSTTNIELQGVDDVGDESHFVLLSSPFLTNIL